MRFMPLTTAADGLVIRRDGEAGDSSHPIRRFSLAKSAARLASRRMWARKTFRS
jgi:hypothetical protein